MQVDADGMVTHISQTNDQLTTSAQIVVKCAGAASTCSFSSQVDYLTVQIINIDNDEVLLFEE